MSYALIPLVFVLGWIGAIIFLVIMYGVTLEVIGRTRRWYHRQRARMHALRELNALTDVELRDIGITRCDVDRVARETAEYRWG